MSNEIEQLEEAIEECAREAKEAANHDADAALKLTQAALNAAHTLSTLSECQLDFCP